MKIATWHERTISSISRSRALSVLSGDTLKVGCCGLKSWRHVRYSPESSHTHISQSIEPGRVWADSTPPRWIGSILAFLRWRSRLCDTKNSRIKIREKSAKQNILFKFSFFLSASQQQQQRAILCCECFSISGAKLGIPTRFVFLSSRRLTQYVSDFTARIIVHRLCKRRNWKRVQSNVFFSEEYVARIVKSVWRRLGIEEESGNCNPMTPYRIDV